MRHKYRFAMLSIISKNDVFLASLEKHYLQLQNNLLENIITGVQFDNK